MKENYKPIEFGLGFEISINKDDKELLEIIAELNRSGFSLLLPTEMGIDLSIEDYEVDEDDWEDYY